MADQFARTRALFDLPRDVVYLDGNSLGPLTLAAKRRIEREVSEQWGGKLIRGWNEAGWMDLPASLGNKIAGLIGAPRDTVMVCDSTSINLHKALTAALALNGKRKVILSDSGNFPSDLYVAQGVAAALGGGHRLKTVAPEAVSDAIDESVAVLMLTEVDYRTGRLHDMAALTAKAHEAGSLAIWDLAHSAGAFPVHLERTGADFAVGCGYKYLNGGPGAPGFVYVRPGHSGRIAPALAGWMGHAAPFDFDRDYRPAPGIERMRVGTPPVLSMAALDAAMSVWDGIAMADVRRRSIELSQRFILEVETRCPELTLAAPRDPRTRGSQVSFRHPEGYAVMQALIARGVVGDFRAPGLLRFGVTPLYIGMDDIVRAAEVLEAILRGRLWDRPEFKARKKVT